MVSALLAGSLFVAWLVIGRAALVLGRFPVSPSRAFLLAPAVGLSVVEVVGYQFIDIGWPVERFALAMMAGLVLCAGGVCWQRNCRWDIRRTIPLAGLLIAGFALVGWPMLDHGFHWLAFGNDDMGNYCASATRILHHGADETPPIDEMIAGQNYPQYYWFMTTAGMTRVGSELLIALASATSGHGAIDVFMATILAQQLCLMAAAAALVDFAGRNRRATWLALGLMAVSAPMAYSVYQQLIAQVGGLAIQFASFIILTHRIDRQAARDRWPRWALLGIVLAAMLIHYPELSPFIVVTFIGYTFVFRVRGGRIFPLFFQSIVAVMVVSVFTRGYFVGAFAFTLSQSAHGVSGNDQSTVEILRATFPYFQDWSGFARLWGYQSPVSGHFGLFTDRAALFGSALTVLVLLQSSILAYRGKVLGWAALVIAGVGFFLWTTGGVFGLFKLALFAQPIILGVLAIGVVHWCRFRLAIPVLASLAVAVFLGNAQAQLQLRDRSESFYGASGLPGGSTGSAIAETRQLIQQHQPTRLLVDSSSETLVRLLGTELVGIPTQFLSMDLFDRIALHSDRQAMLLPEHAQIVFQYAERRLHAPRDHVDLHSATKATFNMVDVPPPPWTPEPNDGSYLLGSTGKISVLNRFHHPKSSATSVFLQAMDNVRHHAVFVDSHLGHQVLLRRSGKDVGIYQLEADPALGGSFAAVGRYLAIQVLHPGPSARILLDVTTSYRPASPPSVMNISFIGDQCNKFPLAGAGASRIVTEPLTPQKIGEHSYYMIDFGDNPPTAPTVNGAMEFTSIDHRQFVAHLRDLSILSDDDYLGMDPPTSIQSFPADLNHAGLLYSGVFEDGWLGPKSQFRLSSPSRLSQLVVEGLFPASLVDDAQHTQMTISIDGREVLTRSMALGQFAERIPTELPPGAHSVELQFSCFRPLSKNDQRLLSVHLDKLAFEPVPELADQRHD